MELVPCLVERSAERRACVHGLVQRLLGGPGLWRERVAGGRDDTSATEAFVTERPAGAGGAAVEIGELGGGGDPARTEQADGLRRQRHAELVERAAHHRAGEAAAGALVERAEAGRELAVVEVEAAPGRGGRGGEAGHATVNAAPQRLFPPAPRCQRADT